MTLEGLHLAAPAGPAAAVPGEPAGRLGFGGEVGGEVGEAVLYRTWRPHGLRGDVAGMAVWEAASTMLHEL